MAIFVIFRATHPDLIRASLQSHFPENHLQLQNDEWLVAATGTAKELSDTLGITKGESGSAIIFAMANYFGRASTEVWDWIKAKAEQSSG